MPPSGSKFFLIGLLVAALEEFITQGVLKGNLLGWMVPTLIAFFPFLVIVRWIGRRLHACFGEWQAVLGYYLTAGAIGLALEWSLLGLGPWKDWNLLQIPFQFGMFSFWVGVAFAPRLLLDTRDFVSGVRRMFRIWLWVGMAVIYGVTFAAPKEARFWAAVGSVILTFTLLNVCYYKYIQLLARQSAHLTEAGLKAGRAKDFHR